jgi:hypothetical protein
MPSQCPRFTSICHDTPHIRFYKIRETGNLFLYKMLRNVGLHKVVPQLRLESQQLMNSQSGINCVLSCSLQSFVEILFAVTNIQRKEPPGCLREKCLISSKSANMSTNFSRPLIV